MSKRRLLPIHVHSTFNIYVRRIVSIYINISWLRSVNAGRLVDRKRVRCCQAIIMWTGWTTSMWRYWGLLISLLVANACFADCLAVTTAWWSQWWRLQWHRNLQWKLDRLKILYMCLYGVSLAFVYNTTIIVYVIFAS